MDLHKIMQTGKGLDELEQNLLDLDSEFRFKCRRCGKCCIHQDTILLTARDLFHIAKKQGRAMRDVIESYTEVYLGKNSRIPVVHLISNGPKGACPLLVDGKCSVHDCKPTVCALYPLGRVAVFPKKEDGSQDLSRVNVRYILNDHICGSAKRVNTVRSWLARFGIPEEDEFYLFWTETIAALSTAIRRLEADRVPEPGLDLLCNIIFSTLYLDYNMNLDFLPQFKAAAERLKKLAATMQGPVFAERMSTEAQQWTKPN